MVSFQTKNPTLGMFWRTFGIKNVVLYCGRLECFTIYQWVYFIVILHIFPAFGKLYQATLHKTCH
jgi:hypothetical protein